MIFKSVYVTITLALVDLINPSSEEKTSTGTASFYANKFEGRLTSSGQRYRGSKRTAAHRTYPFGTLLEVTNHNNGLKTTVRINDRGPHIKNRLIDLSYSAAQDLALINSGTANVTLKVISFGKNSDPQYFEDETELTETITTTSTPSIFTTFKPDLVEKKYQYMNLLKLADGTSKIVYSDTKL